MITDGELQPVGNYARKVGQAPGQARTSRAIPGPGLIRTLC